ncbi:MAG: hypothetical protein ACM3ZT_01415 [Bacillota bacterium]
MSAQNPKAPRPVLKQSKKQARKPTTPEEIAQGLRQRKALDTGSSEVERYLNSGVRHFGL